MSITLKIAHPKHVQGLTGEAAEAQEYLMKMPNRVRKLAERAYGAWACLSSFDVHSCEGLFYVSGAARFSYQDLQAGRVAQVLLSQLCCNLAMQPLLRMCSDVNSH